MPVKDLYYQKYVKYKNKYLNLLNLLNQIGGSPPNIPDYTADGLFLRVIDTENLIYSITYNSNNKNSFLNLGPANIKFIINELTENTHIKTVKLNNLGKLYSAYYIGLSTFYKLIPEFPEHITTLIFDGNQLSETGIIDLIINFIKKFKNVSKLSFKLCQLTAKSAGHLQKELLKLKQQIIEINLEDNDNLTS